MTECIIVSDSHHNEEILKHLIEQYPSLPIYHCGDSELPDTSIVFQHIKTVAGNCDFESEVKPLERVEQLDDIIFFITHGHRYKVKSSYYPIEMAGKEHAADIVLFGHSHVPFVDYDKEQKVLLINPGSIEQPRIFPPQKTYVHLKITPNTYYVTYLNEKDEILKTLTFQR